MANAGQGLFAQSCARGARELKRQLAAILAADVVNYSGLMGEDADATLDALRKLRSDVLEPVIADHGGEVVKRMGDGWLVQFAAVSDAVASAIRIQERLIDHARIKLRIGIHIGDVTHDEEDIYGDGINIAARLQAIAAPGGIVISEFTRRSIDEKLAAAFVDIGIKKLKNIAQPIAAHGWGMIGRAETEPTPSDARQSIAVLPFTNMSGDPEQEYFSDGITEDIITDLSRIANLLTLARNSTFSYKGRSVPAQQISQELGTTFIVEGSVRKAGNRVRVTAQLIDGGSGGHVWAERYDRDLTDIFEVQDEIAKNIVDALKIAIAPDERRAIERIPTRNLAAYDCYLRGRQFLHEMTKEQLERGREMFLDAVALDPGFALALAGLANCDAVLYQHYSTDRRVVETAISNSRRALELDPDLAEAHAAMGHALSLLGDNANAEREFEAALALDPMLYEIYWYRGLAKITQGDFAAAAQLFSQASKVRGDDLQSKMMLMNAFLGLGRDADKRSAAKEAFAIASRRLELNPDDSRAAYIGAQALVHLDDRARALRWLNMAARIDSTDPRTTYNLACCYSTLGETEKALDFLELSIKGGRPIGMLEWARTDPDLEPVRAEPRFAALLTCWRERFQDAQ